MKHIESRIRKLEQHAPEEPIRLLLAFTAVPACSRVGMQAHYRCPL